MKYPNSYLKYAVSLCALAHITSAHASPITANVIGSSVGDKGDTGMEYRSGYEWDGDNAAQDNRFTDRVDVFHNITTDTQLRMFVNRVNPGNDDSDFSSVFIEPAFQMFHADKDGFDGAILTGLTLADGDDGAHQVRTVLTGTLPMDEWYMVHNSVIAHEFGAEKQSGVKYEARWRVMYKAQDNMHVGVEMFNNFGNLRTANGFDRMTHRAGAVVTGNFTDQIGYQSGVLAGLSDDAPDVAAKFWLSYQFNTDGGV